MAKFSIRMLAVYSRWCSAVKSKGLWTPAISWKPPWMIVLHGSVGVENVWCKGGGRRKEREV